MTPPSGSGDLRHQITPQTLVETYDSQNQPIRTPVNQAPIMARVTPTSSAEAFVGAQKTTRTQWEIWIRYRPDWQAQQCLFRGKLLRFEGNPIDWEEKRRWLFVRAIEDSASV